MRVYLIVESYYPTIHKNKKEAEEFATFVRDTDRESKKLKALYCEFSEKDFKEKFCNCVFKSI